MLMFFDGSSLRDHNDRSEWVMRFRCVDQNRYAILVLLQNTGA